MRGLNIPEKARGFSAEAVQELSWRKAEPEWVRQRRLQAWRLYEEIPLPTGQEEAWRRTDISALNPNSLIPFATPGYEAQALGQLPLEIRALLGEGEEKAGLLVQHDSQGVYRFLSPELAQRGVIFTTLDRAVGEYPALVQEHLMTDGRLPMDGGKFAALNGAFFSGGAFLYVPKGVAIALPVRALFWGGTPGLGLFPRTLIVAAAGSQLTYINEYASSLQDGPGFSSGVVDIYLREGAQVRYVSLQRWGPKVYNFATQRAWAERDSAFSSLTVSLGSQLTKANAEAFLQGPGARAQMAELLLGAATQHFDYHTLQDHLAPHTTSDFLFKAALKGRARSVFVGLIRVRKAAQQSDSYQANRNLLLSPQAKADSIPKLEIEAHDVRCSHGATVGPIDEEQCYYLMSRGLSRPEAEKMIVEGFFEPLIQRLPLEGMRETVREAVTQKQEASS